MLRAPVNNLQLGKYDLYENLNIDDSVERFMLAVDGNNSVLQIAEKLNISFDRVKEYEQSFRNKGLIR